MCGFITSPAVAYLRPLLKLSMLPMPTPVEFDYLCMLACQDLHLPEFPLAARLVEKARTTVAPDVTRFTALTD